MEYRINVLVLSSESETILAELVLELQDNTSDARILHHRDAAFASAPARLLNLGNTANFSYSQDRRNSDPDLCATYQLNPGDLIEFHCKYLHACTEAAPGRIGLVMWQLKPNYAALV